jgi:hypothetical protein
MPIGLLTLAVLLCVFFTQLILAPVYFFNLIHLPYWLLLAFGAALLAWLIGE